MAQFRSGVRDTAVLRSVVVGCMIAVTFRGPARAEPVAAMARTSFPVAYVDGNQFFRAALAAENRAKDVVHFVVGDRRGTVDRDFKAYIGAAAKRTSALRWRAAHECVWIMGNEAGWFYDGGIRVRYAHLGFFDLAKPDRLKLPNPDFPLVTSSEFGWDLFPSSYWAREMFTGRAEGTVDALGEKELCYDFLPTSDDGGFLFVLSNSRMTVFRGKQLPRAPRVINYVVKYDEIVQLPVEFQEPICSFGGAESCALVTRSGKIYSWSPKSPKNAVETVWKEKDYTFEAIVQDVPTKTTYLLARSRGDGPTKCLTLDSMSKLTVRDLKPGAVAKPEADKPLDVCLPFARFLFDEKIIAPVKP